MQAVRCKDKRCDKLLVFVEGEARIKAKCPRCHEMTDVYINTEITSDKAKKEFVAVTTTE